jgi:hypothetical protein
MYRDAVNSVGVLGANDDDIELFLVAHLCVYNTASIRRQFITWMEFVCHQSILPTCYDQFRPRVLCLCCTSAVVYA